VAGINVALDGRHDPEQVIQAGGDAVRIVLSTQLDQTNILRAYKDRGLYRLGVYDGDSDNEFPNHDEAMAYYSNLYGPYLSAVQVGNEPDLMESPSSWDDVSTDASEPGMASPDTLRGADAPGVCGMASGQPQWLETLDIPLVQLPGRSALCQRHEYASEIHAAPARPTSLRGRTGDRPEPSTICRTSSP
jgi:hypothetical protein